MPFNVLGDYSLSLERNVFLEPLFGVFLLRRARYRDSDLGARSAAQLFYKIVGRLILCGHAFYFHYSVAGQHFCAPGRSIRKRCDHGKPSVALLDSYAYAAELAVGIAFNSLVNVRFHKLGIIVKYGNHALRGAVYYFLRVYVVDVIIFYQRHYIDENPKILICPVHCVIKAGKNGAYKKRHRRDSREFTDFNHNK